MSVERENGLRGQDDGGMADHDVPNQRRGDSLRLKAEAIETRGGSLTRVNEMRGKDNDPREIEQPQFQEPQDPVGREGNNRPEAANSGGEAAST